MYYWILDEVQWLYVDYLRMNLMKFMKRMKKFYKIWKIIGELTEDGDEEIEVIIICIDIMNIVVKKLSVKMWN